MEGGGAEKEGGEADTLWEVSSPLPLEQLASVIIRRMASDIGKCTYLCEAESKQLLPPLDTKITTKYAIIVREDRFCSFLNQYVSDTHRSRRHSWTANGKNHEKERPRQRQKCKLSNK